MTTKHTPGPWKLSGANTVHGADCIVAFVGTADEEVRRFSDERQSADAHLIAAAPDLLAACLAGLNKCSYGCTPKESCGICGVLFAAIAKAKGETK